MATIVVDADGDGFEAASLADLAQETIQRFHHGHTETVIAAIRRGDDIDTCRVHRKDIVPSPVLGGSR